jgi:hypothetical protein
MSSVAPAEKNLVRELGQRRTATLDELVAALPQHSWSQIFLAVDRLSRNGTLTLTHPDRLHYVVALAAPPEGSRYGAEADSPPWEPSLDRR